MSGEKMLGSVRARAGEPNGYRSVHGDVPRLDAVVLQAAPLWLKGDRLVEAHLSPSEARRLAIDLLTAAENVEARQASR